MLSNNERFRNFVVFGEVLGVHISEDILTDGLVDNAKARLVARLGYRDFAVIDEVFSMPFPV